MRYLSVTSNAPEAAEFVIVNGPPYSPFVVIEPRQLGADTWQHQRSGPRGTQGRRPAAGQPDDRPVRIALDCTAASQDELDQHMSDLQAACDEQRRFGGRITFQMHNQSYRQHLTVLEGAFALEDWGQGLDTHFRALPLLVATCAPYVSGDPMDVDLTFDAAAELEELRAAEGALDNVTVVDGQLAVAANPTTYGRFLHVQRGYRYFDPTQILAVTPGSTITGFWAGLVAKTDALATTYLEAALYDDGTNSKVRIDKVVAGSRTTLASANLSARIVAGTAYWLRFEVNGVQLRARVFSNDPLLLNVATLQTASYTLTGTDVDTFGPGASGRAGFSWQPQHSAATLGEYRLRAFYGENADHSRQTLRGLPGDAPALLEASFANRATLQGSPFGMFTWSRKPPTWNQCWNGSFEDVYGASNTTPRGWTAAGITGITGAATSIYYASGSGLSGWVPKFGLDAAVIVCPATANRGAAFILFGDFRAGVTYTAELWAYSPSQTTLARIRAGVSGDVASSTPAALSPTYTKHAITWTPAADQSVAYLAFEITAATATTMLIDGVAFYEGTAAPALSTQMDGRGAFPPIGFIAAAAASKVTGLAVSGAYLSDATTSSAGESYAADFRVDPSLILADDYTDREVEIEVWADIILSDANGAATVTASSVVRGGSLELAVVPSSEGSRVISRTTGSYPGLFRLGTVRLSLEDSTRQEWLIRVEIDVAAGTGGEETALRAIFLAPARAVAKGQTADTSVPYFIPGADITSLTVGHVRTVRPDLSGLVGTNYYNGGPAIGLMGSLLEIPVGDVEIHMLDAAFPDTQNDNGFGIDAPPRWLPRPQFLITPRWGKLRTAPEEA